MTTDQHYCLQCGAISSRRIEHRTETIPVRGEPIDVDVDVAVCVECNQDVADIELDDAALEHAYSIYRQRHGILAADQIRAIRARTGLSQRGFGRLLGWGDVTVHRYETGAIPDMAHNNLLLALQDDDALFPFVNARMDALSTLDQRKVNAHVAARRLERAEASVRRGLEQFIGAHSASERGNREFDLERTGNMIVYFVSRCRTTTTKLNKLLWYADFLSFKRTSMSISGLPYVRLPFGPVPDHYKLLLVEVEQEGFVKSDVSASTSDYPRTDYEALVPFDESLFAPDEIDILQTVCTRFGTCTASRAAELSHLERAWIDTPEAQVISYSLARHLSLD